MRDGICPFHLLMILANMLQPLRPCLVGLILVKPSLMIWANWLSVRQSFKNCSFSLNILEKNGRNMAYNK